MGGVVVGRVADDEPGPQTRHNTDVRLPPRTQLGFRGEDVVNMKFSRETNVGERKNGERIENGGSPSCIARAGSTLFLPRTVHHTEAG